MHSGNVKIFKDFLLYGKYKNIPNKLAFNGARAGSSKFYLDIVVVEKNFIDSGDIKILKHNVLKV